MSKQPDPVTEHDLDSDLAPETEVAAAVVGAFPADEQTPDSAEALELDDVTDDAAPAGGDEPDDPRTREELLVAVTTAERQRDEYLDDLRRARADFENFRRRTQREAGTARDAGRGDVVTALLDVLDDLDRTLEATDGSSDPNLATGVSLVASKLMTSLGNLGVARLDPTGQPFDPSVHEAVQHVPAEEPSEGPVVERTLRPGYQLGDRVLRPAMVVVTG